ncbi:LacI family DNA-binding transcriptional regulator [Paenibacillus sp. strain BS8-2]
MRSKVTIQTIADSVGLSKYAVSRALAGKSGVSAESKAIILHKAAELGYRKEPVSVRAASESYSRNSVMIDEEHEQWSGSVLVLFPDVRAQNQESAYWGPLFEGITEGLNAKGINIVSLTKPDIDSMFSLLNPQALMGMITVGNISSPILHEAGRLGIPVVMVDHLDPSFPCDTIFSDNLAGINDVMSDMLGRGYRRYQFIGNIEEAYSFYERWVGFSVSLMNADIAHVQIPELLRIDYESYKETIAAAFAARPLPEVLVCANDYYAGVTKETLQELGHSTKDMMFTGFDNMRRNVSSVTINVEEKRLGLRAVDQLLWRLRNPDASPERMLIRGEYMTNE